MEIMTVHLNNNVPAQYFPLIYLIIILFIASFIDFRTQKIPNVLTFSSTFIALIYHVYSGGLQGFFFSFLGVVVGIAVLIIPYAMGGMGAGDVKLMGTVGSFLGAKGAVISFLFTALFGGIYAFVIILLFRNIFRGYFKHFFHSILNFFLTKKYSPDSLIENKKKPRLCYGIAIALGTFTYIGLNILGYKFLF